MGLRLTEKAMVAVSACNLLLLLLGMLLLLHLLLLARGRLTLLCQLMYLRQGRPAILAVTAADSCVALARPGAFPRTSIP